MLDDLLKETRELWARADRVALSRMFEEQIAHAGKPRSLVGAIKSQPHLSFIFEIKRKSPSAGVLQEDIDAPQRALLYQKYNAVAVSVLTEAAHFGGSLVDLRKVSESISIPVLRKDFILDDLQLLESRANGADAVLLMVSVLRFSTGQFLNECRRLGLEALVEVRSEEELKIAVDCGAALIGINNRNLDTLEIDLDTTARLLPQVPADRLVVAESGITSRRDVDTMRVLGIDAVLIGSVLSSSESVTAKLGELTACILG